MPRRMAANHLGSQLDQSYSRCSAAAPDIDVRRCLCRRMADAEQHRTGRHSRGVRSVKAAAHVILSCPVGFDVTALCFANAASGSL